MKSTAARLHAICLVKNEDDVISQSLTFASQFCDRIHVIDNGSTDATWTIVNELARHNPTIVPFEQTTLPYGDGLRARVYNAVHETLSDQDWWLILDADEFFVDDPRLAAAAAARQRANVVFTWQVQFYYTERDLEMWNAGRDRPETPITDRRRYYEINWQEPRLFRNLSTRPWDTRGSIKLPDGPRRVATHRPLNRHYQFRDPEQMQKRLALRFGHPLFPHVHSSDWRDQIRKSRTLNFHSEGEPWRFSAKGLVHFYGQHARHRLISAYRGGAVRRVRRLFAPNA